MGAVEGVRWLNDRLAPRTLVPSMAWNCRAAQGSQCPFEAQAIMGERERAPLGRERQ